MPAERRSNASLTRSPGVWSRIPGFGWPVAALALAAATVAAQRAPLPLPLPDVGGEYEASGVVPIAGTSAVLFVDNTRPKHVFWTEFDAAGREAGSVVPVALGVDVPDPEDIATDGRYFYVVGSQSQGGGRRAAGLVRFMFDNRTRQAVEVESVSGLTEWLAGAVPALRGGSGRGRGAPFLNIEGLVWDAPRSRLLLGLRSPMSGEAALVVPLVIKDVRAPFTAENIELAAGGPIRLTLGGLGIRGLGFDPASKHLLVIAGVSTYSDAQTFRLFDWDGVSAAPGRELATFPAREKPEGVAIVAIAGRPRTLIVFDTGGYQFLN